MFERFVKAAATGAAVTIISGITFWGEQRRINEWKKSHEGKDFEMRHQSIAGTTGYYYPVERNSTVQNGRGK